MSDAPDRDQKQFEPSAQRLQKAREEGNVFHSKDIVSAGLLMTGMVIILMGASPAFGRLKHITRLAFTASAQTPLTERSVQAIIVDFGLQVSFILLPFFGAVFLMAMGLNVFQTGLNITTKPLMPKGDRINPMAGLKRIFSSKSLFELLKALVKIVLVAPLAYGLIEGHLPEILMLHTSPVDTTLMTAAGWIQALLVKLVLVLFVLAGADYAYERWRYRTDLKMTFQEMKDESKEQDGDPQMKGKRRAFARKLISRPRLDHAVLKADVVITNPTHYAVALRYNPAESGAPRVIVKGIRKRALRIKALAIEHGIPTIEDRPLARTLYNTVAEEQEIPEELYPAVAAVLAEIYRTRNQGN